MSSNPEVDLQVTVHEKKLLQMKRVFSLLLLFLCSLPIAAQIKRSQPAPDFNLPDPSGKMHALSSFKGTVVLVDFWASWCMPCRFNNPSLVKLYAKYGQQGFQIVGISLDKDRAAWQKAIKSDKLTWTQLLDDANNQQSPTLVYGVTAIPTTFLIDKVGVVRAANLHGRELDAMVSKLITE
jgi:peroxiredoxin